MDNLEKRVLLAQSNSSEIDGLLRDYLPFIKKQIAIMMQMLGLEYDDMLSLAMLTFVGCIKQYCENKGNFLSFTAVSIKNRLIDESRKQQKHSAKVVSIHADNESDDVASLGEYSREQERHTLAYEIDMLSLALQPFGVKFSELPKTCPKQNGSRRRCVQIAQLLIQDDDMQKSFVKNKRISQSELAKRLNISEKTIEKHRKYIVTICVLLMGDYPTIKAFLPQFKEVK